MIEQEAKETKYLMRKSGIINACNGDLFQARRIMEIKKHEIIISIALVEASLAIAKRENLIETITHNTSILQELNEDREFCERFETETNNA